MDAKDSKKPAWVSQTKRIGRFFDRVEKRRASAACIQGPHAAGKSTTLVAHILDQVRAKIPDTPVIYLLPTSLEVSRLVEYLSSDEFNEQLPAKVSEHLVTEPPEEDLLPAGALYVVSYHAMLGFLDFRKRFPFGQRAVVLFDLDANPTTEGELLFGRLLEWAVSCHDAERPAGAVVTISPAPSARTEDILKKVIGRKPDLIEIPGAGGLLVPLSPMREQWMEEAKELLRGAWDNPPADHFPGRVFIGYQLADQDTVDMNIAVVDRAFTTHKLCDAALSRDFAAMIDTTLGLSFPLEDLRHFVSLGLVEEDIFDRRTSHIVFVTRQATKAEILREQSWLLKSNCYLEVVFHTKYQQGDFERFPAGSDPPGQAYRGDIFWTALNLVGQWPGKAPSALPIRSPPDNRAMAEVMRRIIVLGCITPPVGVDIGQLSAKGRLMLDTRRVLQDLGLGGIDVHAAHLLTCAQMQGHSSNLQRVIIQMAALLAHGIHTMCTKVESDAQAYLHKVVVLDADIEEDPIDCVSQRPFSTSAEEILDSHLALERGHCVIKNVTMIPRGLIRQVGEQRGIPFQALVATEYPLRT
ncbi:hypothetical protein GGS26DRAFT_575832 [Hypomontagnella submonticulosa]|nr:hypothetical protein GGS26DRAFT_575832 [Hypomontagnella submonticulosa]